MIVDKVHEVISFQQSKWLEKNIDFNTQKRNIAKTNLKKFSIIYSKTHPMEKLWKMFVME